MTVHQVNYALLIEDQATDGAPSARKPIDVIPKEIIQAPHVRYGKKEMAKRMKSVIMQLAARCGWISAYYDGRRPVDNAHRKGTIGPIRLANDGVEDGESQDGGAHGTHRSGHGRAQKRQRSTVRKNPVRAEPRRRWQQHGAGRGGGKPDRTERLGQRRMDWQVLRYLFYGIAMRLFQA